MSLSVKEKRYIYNKIKKYVTMPEINQLANYVQHGKVNCLQHSMSVAYCSFLFCKKFHIKVDYNSLVRGAMMHDYFLYDWHIPHPSHRLHGFYHPSTACRNACNLFDLNEIEKDIIRKHMWPLTVVPPKYKEAYIICFIDKICSLTETFHLDVFRVPISF